MRRLTAAVLISTLVYIAGCRETCSNGRQSQQLSPNGEWKYVAFDRNCGATTRDNFQLRVLPANGKLPNDAGNVFIGDDDHGHASWVARPEWVSANRLRIAYSVKARVFKKAAKAGPVEIEYAEQ